MTDADEQILKTLVHYLIASKHAEAAAAIIDAEIWSVLDGGNDEVWIVILLVGEEYLLLLKVSNKERGEHPVPIVIWWWRRSSFQLIADGSQNRVLLQEVPKLF